MAKQKKNKKGGARIRAEAEQQRFDNLNDPAFLEFIRTGQSTGARIRDRRALSNMALFRSITLISQTIGMLPLNLISRGHNKAVAQDHALYSLLKTRPNNYQTAFEFKRLLQGWVLQYGNAYAHIVRGVGDKVLALHPIHPNKVTVEQQDDFSLLYTIMTNKGAIRHLRSNEILHLKDFSDDGIIGLARVKLAEKVLGIAFDAENAAESLFTRGILAGGALSSPNALSDTAYNRLRDEMRARHTGAENAGNFFILEEGLKAEKWSNTASDAQHLEQRNHQIEEVARLFGVPRPLLMMDDTSWGSGIGQLGLFFHKYGLLPWFTVWEQALEVSLLSRKELELYAFKFNADAILRGSLEEQANYFSKALGSGGGKGWLSQNEIRDILDCPQVATDAANELPQQIIKNNSKSSEKDSTTAI